MALPTMVPTPISEPALGLMSAMAEDASSGAEEPAAMNVAPATSSDSRNTSQIFSSDATKKSSHTMAMPRNMKNTPTKYATMPPFFSQSGVSPHDPPALSSARPWRVAEGSRPNKARVKLAGSLSPEYTVIATVVTAAATTSSCVLFGEGVRMRN